MSVYIIPVEGDFEEVTDVAKKAGVRFVSPQTVREFILETHNETMVIAAVRGQDMLVFNKHSATLFDEMPAIVMSAPGIVYTGDWVALATAFPAVDWTDLASKLAKSGHLATTPEQLENRETGVAKESFDDMTRAAEGVRPKLGSKPTSPSYSDDEADDPDMEVD